MKKAWELYFIRLWGLQLPNTK